MLTQVQTKTLSQVLNKILRVTVSGASHHSINLKGGTVGDVCLVTGIAQTTTDDAIPYKLVLKIQKKWARWGDPLSWRREYDLYKSCLAETFSNTFCWPKCYHAELNGDETQLWMEYIEGITGYDLTTPMMEKAAYELGRYQGKLQPDSLKSITNLDMADARETHYRHWKPKNLEYSYIRSSDCPIPKHLCDMLIDVDTRADDIFNRIKQLPIVLCHRDYWVNNIFFANGCIYAIDWDSTGWGYLGEDIISLITDETNPAFWAEYKTQLIPAYLGGIAESIDIAELDSSIIGDMALTSGYMYVHYYMHEESQDKKEGLLMYLQQLYEVFYRV